MTIKPATGAATANLVRTTHAAFVQAGLSPSIHFCLSDGGGRKASSVARVVKRFPELARFDQTRPAFSEADETQRLLSNEADAPEAGASVELATLLEIVAGIPRRYPFFMATVRLSHPVFGPELADQARSSRWGVIIEDWRGANKRRVRQDAVVFAEADPAAKSLPSLTGVVAAVLNGCGRHTLPTPTVMSGHGPEAAAITAAIVKQTSTGLIDVVERFRLPHNIPLRDVRQPERHAASRKPALVDAVRPLGYNCRGQDMTNLVCRRRSTSNVTTTLDVDFGTWRSTIDATWSAAWLGGSLGVELPRYSKSGPHGLALGLDEARWRQIAENLAALVAELDRLVLPIVDSMAGPTPAWYPGEGLDYRNLLRLPGPVSAASSPNGSGS